MRNFKYIFIGIIFFIVALYGVYLYGLKKEAGQNVQLQPGVSVSPSSKTQVYTNKELALTLQYPQNYIMKDVTREKSGHLLFLVFTPSVGKSYEGIQVVVFPRMDRQTLEGWIAAYTTSANTANLATGSRSYMIDQVSGLSYKAIEDKRVAVFSQGPENSADMMLGTLFMGKNYVIYVAQLKSLVGKDYQLLLSSINL